MKERVYKRTCMQKNVYVKNVYVKERVYTRTCI